MTDDLLKRAEPFLTRCASCDGKLPRACPCSTGDFRPVMLALAREVERLRKVAWTYLRAMNDQHAVFSHYLDGCEKCHAAAEECDPDLACDNYKRWQREYMNALGQVIEEVAW
jgi:cellulase/cellobiase CelA1